MGDVNLVSPEKMSERSELFFQENKYTSPMPPTPNNQP
jgi:hypothetical protein